MNKKSGIYIHFPFCNVKCGYCDFYSIVNRKESIPDFIKSIVKEIGLYFNSNNSNNLKFDTIFLGGGTPSLIEPHYIEKIFKALSNHIDFSIIKEITIEANPGETSKDYLNGYKEIGINRVSFGFQSLDDKLLKFLDRLHSAKQCIVAFEEARKAGFENINTDMIFNIPGQSLDILSENLKSVIKLQPDHISSYSLTVEKGTMLYNNVSKGKVVMPDEELDYNMYEMTSSIMSNNKYSQYEASNYAKINKECLHNLHYWDLDPYIAFGPSAHGYDGKKRWWNHRSLGLYLSILKKNKLPIKNTEILSSKNKFNEIIMNGLRTSKGINIEKLNRITTLINLEKKIKKWPQLVMEDKYLKLKDNDFMLLDEITADLFIV
ncbi:MAG: hypothetical protein CBD21_04160 [bacterium TMED161]|nr:MAG: hypothetical protein CBD21_04160 [bacterium TMED161]